MRKTTKFTLKKTSVHLTEQVKKEHGYLFFPARKGWRCFIAFHSSLSASPTHLRVTVKKRNREATKRKHRRNKMCARISLVHVGSPAPNKYIFFNMQKRRISGVYPTWRCTSGRNLVELTAVTCLFILKYTARLHF